MAEWKKKKREERKETASVELTKQTRTAAKSAEEINRKRRGKREGYAMEEDGGRNEGK